RGSTASSLHLTVPRQGRLEGPLAEVKGRLGKGEGGRAEALRGGAGSTQVRGLPRATRAVEVEREPDNVAALAGRFGDEGGEDGAELALARGHHERQGERRRHRFSPEEVRKNCRLTFVAPVEGVELAARREGGLLRQEDLGGKGAGTDQRGA